jgi:hypothetical protein
MTCHYGQFMLKHMYHVYVLCNFSYFKEKYFHSEKIVSTKVLYTFQSQNGLRIKKFYFLFEFSTLFRIALAKSTHLIDLLIEDNFHFYALESWERLSFLPFFFFSIHGN